MTAPRFLIESPLAVGEIELPQRIAHHAQHVLRLADGAGITLFNGAGGQWHAHLLLAGKRARAKVIAFEPIDRESPLALTVLQAWIAADKLDWMVEKATELGVTQILLLPAARSQIRLAGERLQRRLDHLRAVAGAACAQCGRNTLPVVAAAPNFAAALASVERQVRLVLSPDAEAATILPALTQACALLVGPEGGFTPEELNAAVTAGFVATRLGPRTLRTETAALVACSILQSMVGDLRIEAV